jgi:hypothetical protein
MARFQAALGIAPPANAQDVARKMIDRNTRLAIRCFMQSSDRRCNKSVLVVGD